MRLGIAGLLRRICGDSNGRERTGLKTRHYKCEDGYKPDQAADSERKTRWSGASELDADELFAFGLGLDDVHDAPWVEKSASALRESAELPGRREAYCERECGFRGRRRCDVEMRQKAAPLRQRFSLAVSSSKGSRGRRVRGL